MHVQNSVRCTLLQDLQKAMPDLAHGLQQLLDYRGNVEVDLAATFSVEEEIFGEVQTHELKPGGSSIAVTNSNRQEYVDLYTSWVLQESIHRQFAAFSEGFHQVRPVCTDALNPKRILPVKPAMFQPMFWPLPFTLIIASVYAHHVLAACWHSSSGSMMCS